MAKDIFYIKLTALVTASFVFFMVFFKPVPFHSDNYAYSAVPVVLGVVGAQALRVGAKTLAQKLATRQAAVLATRTLTPAVRGADGVYRVSSGARWGGKIAAGATAVAGLASYIMSDKYDAEYQEGQGSEIETEYHELWNPLAEISPEDQGYHDSNDFADTLPTDKYGVVVYIEHGALAGNYAYLKYPPQGEITDGSGENPIGVLAHSTRALYIYYFRFYRDGDPDKPRTYGSRYSSPQWDLITNEDEIAAYDDARNLPAQDSGYYDDEGRKYEIPVDPVALYEYLDDYLSDSSNLEDVDIDIEQNPTDYDPDSNLDVSVTPESMAGNNTIIDAETGDSHTVTNHVYNDFENYFNSEEYTNNEEYTEHHAPEYETDFPEQMNVDYSGPVPEVGDPAQVPEFDPSIELPDKEDIPYQSWIDSVPFVGLLSDSGVELENPNSVVEVPLNFPGLPDAEGVASFDFAEYSGFFQMMGSIIFAVSSFIALRWALGV